MIALDTNIVVYAHRPDLSDHGAATAAIEDLVARGTWGLPWPVAHEFVRVVTDGRRFEFPTPLDVALETIVALLGGAGARGLGEGPAHWSRLSEVARAGRASGPLFYDARIAAICLAEGVSELWTADRDFSRFPALLTRNPLVV